jgi:hypothetical protein
VTLARPQPPVLSVRLSVCLQASCACLCLLRALAPKACCRCAVTTLAMMCCAVLCRAVPCCAEPCRAVLCGGRAPLRRRRQARTRLPVRKT